MRRTAQAVIRWLGLWRPVAGRARSDLPFLAAVWLLVVSAITLLAAGTLYSETVEAGGVRRALLEAAPSERGVAVRFAVTPAELGERDESVRHALAGALGSAGTETALTLRSPTLRPALSPGSEPPPADQRRLLVVGAYDSLAQHAELVEGRWPEAAATPVEAVLSSGAAEALQLAVGDTIQLADASSAGADPTAVVFVARLVGIYAPDRQDPYWRGDEMELSGVEERASAPLIGPLMVDRRDLLASAGFARLDAQWRAIPRAGEVRLDQLDRLRGGIQGLPAAIQSRLPDDRFVVVDGELATVLGRIDRSALVSRSGVLLTTLQFGILAGYAVLLVGGILADRRRPEVALLRARGASTPEVGLIAAGEAALLSVPAALVAPWIALLIVEGVGSWGAFGESGIIAGVRVGELTYAVALAGGLACIVALTVPALLAEVDLARVRAALGRPLAQTTAQRLGLDVVLLVIALIGLAQLSAYGGTLTGTAGGGLGLDPLLVAAPAIALAAGAVLVVRLVPRVGEVAEWLMRRGRGLVMPYSARQTARRPLRYTRSALLIVLAVALGTFGALYSSTWTRSQVDQAAHQAGADLRVSRHQQSRTSPAEMAAALTALPGVRSMAPVSRGQLDAGRAVPPTTFLAVDPEAALATSREAGNEAGAWQAALSSLLAARLPPTALALPAGTRRLAIVVDADLRSSVPSLDGPQVQFEPERWPGIGVMPVIVEGERPPVRLERQRAVYRGAGQRLEFDVAPDLGQESRLAGIELELGAPGETLGEVRLVAIEAATGSDGGWTRLPDPATLDDWAFAFQQLGEASFFFPVRIAIGDTFDGPTIRGDEEHPLPACGSWSTEVGCTGLPHVYRWAPTTETRLTAIASHSLLGATGSAVGDTISAYAGMDVELQLVGGLGTFPSVSSEVPFAIVDVLTLNSLRGQRGLNPVEPNEWWLAVDDAAMAEVAESALLAPINAQVVVSRQDLTRILQRDPIALGMVGALLLGSLTAAGFAVVALLVGAVVSAREQVGELALMRALGVSRRQVLGLLAIEHGFLLGLGVIAGTGLGLLIALLVLPHAPLNRAGEPVVPSPQIVVPWELFALVALAAAALVALSVLVARREVDRRPTVDVLREREG